MDAAKVADTILFLTSVESESNELTSKAIDDWGEEILLASIAQGLPSSIVAIADLESLHPKVVDLAFFQCNIIMYNVSENPFNSDLL